MTDPLVYIRGDQGPDPVFALQQVSPTAGASARFLGSLATAFIRWAAISSPATVWMIPATIASGATPADGLLQGYIGSVAANASLGALASPGRFELQVVTVTPAGRETWPRDEAFPVTIIDRVGGV